MKSPLRQVKWTLGYYATKANIMSELSIGLLFAFFLTWMLLIFITRGQICKYRIFQLLHGEGVGGVGGPCSHRVQDTRFINPLLL